MSGESATEASVIDVHAELCQEFVAKSLARLKENLELLLGQAVTIDVATLGIEQDEPLRKRLPADAIALGLKHQSLECGPALLVLEPALAHTLLAITRVVPSEEINGIRSSATPTISEEDRAAFDELSGFFAASFTDELRKRARKDLTLEPAGSRTLESSSWDGGEDPLGAHAYLVADGSFKLNGIGEDPITLLLPEAMMASLVEEFRDKNASGSGDSTEPKTATEGSAPATASAEGESATLDLAGAPQAVAVQEGSQFILVLGSEETGSRLGQCLGEGLQSVPKLSAVVAQYEQGPAPDLLIAHIGEQEDHLLPMIAAFHRHAGTKALVLLDAPTRSRVLRCASYGLHNILPAREKVEIIASRSRALLGQAAAASG